MSIRRAAGNRCAEGTTIKRPPSFCSASAARIATISGAALFKSKKSVVFGFAANVDAAVTKLNMTPARRATREKRNAEITLEKLPITKRSNLEEVFTGAAAMQSRK